MARAEATSLPLRQSWPQSQRAQTVRARSPSFRKTLRAPPKPSLSGETPESTNHLACFCITGMIIIPNLPRGLCKATPHTFLSKSFPERERAAVSSEGSTQNHEPLEAHAQPFFMECSSNQGIFCLRRKCAYPFAFHSSLPRKVGRASFFIYFFLGGVENKVQNIWSICL